MEDYLERIGLKALPPRPGEQGLRDMHEAQALSIPFENIDIFLGKTVSLDPAVLEWKLVSEKRGGYCFELNSLLRLQLERAGYRVRPVLGRVKHGRPAPGPRSHLLLLVDLDGREWIADAGFGGPGLRSPIPFEADRIDQQFGDSYRLVADPAFGHMLQRQGREGWEDLYAFNATETVILPDIEMSNHFTSTWPQSIFRSRLMCALPKVRGRVTISDHELHEHSGAGDPPRVTPLPTLEQKLKAFRSYFGIDLQPEGLENTRLNTVGAVR